MPWSIWFLPVIVAVSFEQKKEARFDLNLIFVQIHPRRPVKKSQIGCAAATFGFLHIFVTFGALSFALWMFAVAHAFLLLHSCWQLWVCVWKRKCFPTFYLCNGYLFPCDVFFHVAARHCSFLMPCFASNPELYLSARWVYLLGAVGTTLQTRDHNVYVTLWQRWGDGWKWYYDIQTRCSSLRRYKWLFESCSPGGRCHFRSHHQQHLTFFCPPPGAHAGLSWGHRWTEIFGVNVWGSGQWWNGRSN